MVSKKSMSEKVDLSRFDKINFDYYISLAAIEASKGNYTLAGTYLSEVLKSKEESTIVYDLQAKIAAQQGKFREAEFLWKKCLKSDPSNPDYISALNRINILAGAKANRFYFLIDFLKPLVIILLVIVLLFLFFSERWEFKQQWTSLYNQNEELISRTSSLIELNTSNDDLISKISDDMRAISGISIESSANGITLLFDEGLFSRGVIIKSNQMTTLNLVSKVLSTYAGRVLVKIIGSTDRTPVSIGNNFKNNDELSIFRAKAVMDWIGKYSDIPGDDLMIGSPGEPGTIFPDDTIENKLRNRTVVIKIRQKS